MPRTRKNPKHLEWEGRGLCGFDPDRVPKYACEEAGRKLTLEEFKQSRLVDDVRDVTCGNCHAAMKRRKDHEDGKQVTPFYGRKDDA